MIKIKFTNLENPGMDAKFKYIKDNQSSIESYDIKDGEIKEVSEDFFSYVDNNSLYAFDVITGKRIKRYKFEKVVDDKISKTLEERVEVLEKELGKYKSLKLDTFRCEKCLKECKAHRNRNTLYLEDVYEIPQNQWNICNDCLVNFIHWIHQDPRF